MAGTLSKIRTKVRRLTRSLSTSQITNNEVDEYIDDFLLYDFPEHLRLFTLRQKFSWVCDPYIDTYTTGTNASVNALEDFDNNYITIDQPIFVAGQPASYYQDETLFYAEWPKADSIVTIGNGNGSATNFTYTLGDTPILLNSVLISAVDTSFEKLAAIDDPLTAENGNLVDAEDPDSILGTINYQTGAIDITFGTAPKSNTTVQAQFLPYVAGIPRAILYFQNQFVLRPVPDRPYKITLEVYKRPSSLEDDDDVPELEQWWQYIAYGAAKKILEDRTDIEGVQRIMPEFKAQQELVLRRTVVQQGTQRSYTIYADQVKQRPWPGYRGDIIDF